MDVTWAASEVKAFALELATIDNAVVDVYSEYAAIQISADAFGTAAKAKYAGILLTAHLVTIMAAPSSGVSVGGSGAASSMTVGQVSVSYAVPSLDSATLRGGLGLTKYGVEYSRLIRAAGLWAMVLG